MDAYCDHTFYRGMVWLYRYLILDEPVPDFENFASWFSLPVHRKVSNRCSEVGSTEYYDVWKKFFDEAGVLVGMVTYQCRRQSMQELDEEGVDTIQIARMSGHGPEAAAAQKKGSSAMMKSYITNGCVQGSTSRGGGDHRYPKNHEPPRVKESCAVTDDTLRKFLSGRGIPKLAQLLDEREKTNKALDACTTVDEGREKRLYAATDVIETQIADIKWCLQALASIPVQAKATSVLEPTGKKQDGTDMFLSIRERHIDGTFKSLLHNAGFHSDHYLDLVRRVQKAQWEEVRAHSPEAQAARQSESQIADRKEREQTLMLARDTHRLMGDTHRLMGDIAQHIKSGGIPVVAALQQGQHISAQPKHKQSARHSMVQEEIRKRRQPLVQGSGQKKRSRVTQEQTRMVERVRVAGVERPLLDNSIDGDCKDTADFLAVWRENLRPREQAHGNQWRVDLPLDLGSNGKTAAANAKATWWSKRLPLYAFFEVKRDMGFTDEQITTDGDRIMAKAKKKKNQSRIESFRDVFKEALLTETQFASKRALFQTAFRKGKKSKDWNVEWARLLSFTTEDATATTAPPAVSSIAPQATFAAEDATATTAPPAVSAIPPQATATVPQARTVVALQAAATAAAQLRDPRRPEYWRNMVHCHPREMGCFVPQGHPQDAESVANYLLGLYRNGIINMYGIMMQHRPRQQPPESNMLPYVYMPQNPYWNEALR
jgi:hypothetical protein